MTTDTQLTAYLENIQGSSPGVFPSYRTHPWLPYRRADDNLFFTSSILFVLQGVKDGLTPKAAAMLAGLNEKAKTAAAQYQDRRPGWPVVYNFWRIRPAAHFPNGYFMHRFRHFQLPPDADDSVMAYMAFGHSRDEAAGLKELMVSFANGRRKNIMNTLPHYRHLAAYTTWFGKKMYNEFDACVMLNILYFGFFYGLDWNSTDQATAKYLSGIVENGEILAMPFRVSHHYANPATILYHYGRLLGAYQVPGLSPLKDKLCSLARKAWENCRQPEEFAMLVTTFHKLGQDPPKHLPKNANSKPKGAFPFFVNGMMTAYENPYLYRLAAKPFFHLQTCCPAFNAVLRFEAQTCLAQP